MASYTMYLKTAVVAGGSDPGFNEILAALNSYPIFDETHRPGLNQRILDHYWLREIGHETVSIFAFQLGKKLREVMPQYNKLYETELIEFDPLATFNLLTERTDESSSTGNRSSQNAGTNTSTTDSRSISSDFPQTQLADRTDYATSGVDAHSDASTTAGSTGSDTSDGSSTAEGSSRTSGFQGAAADLLTKFRGTILNIDMMVVGDLDELFLGVWDNNQDEAVHTLPLTTFGRILF